MQHFKPLSRQRKSELVIKARKGDEYAMHQMVEANLLFVVGIAKQYNGRGLSFVELISEGNIGLMEAVKRFDETHGFKFITYAVWWVLQAIVMVVAEYSKIARPPVSQVNDLTKVEKQLGVLAQKLGRYPNLEEIALSADVSLDRTRNALDIAQTAVSMDVPAYPEDGGTLIAASADETPDPAEDYERVALSHARLACLELLDQRENLIIHAYFRLDDQATLTLEQIGTRLGLARESVRQLLDRALRKMRARCGLA